MDLERIQQLTPGTVAQQWYEDGVAVDPGVVTVGITADDGTVIVAPGTATSGTTTAPRTFPITTTHTTRLDLLTITWTSSGKGIATGTLEVVGGFLFTLAQVRALSPLGGLTAYPTAAIVEARTMVETALEEACGVAFVPRYRREIVSGSGRSTLMLRPRLRSIRSVLVDDTVVTQTYLDTIRVLPTGEAYYPSWWTQGYANLEIAYEHGYDFPPPRVSQAGLLWVKNFLVKGPIDERTTSMQSEDGTFTLATPGMRGSYTGLPEVDAVIQQYGMEVSIA